MKGNLLLAILALGAVSAAQSADAATHRRAHRHAGNPARVATLSTWTPQTIKTYLWDISTDSWGEDNATVERKTYNDKGQVVSRETTSDYGSYRSVYEYYDNGVLKSEYSEQKESGSTEWIKNSKTVYYYDSVVKDYELYYEEYTWENGTWVLSRTSDKDVIVRDAKGNVTSVDLGWSRYKITYGADGKASKIVFEERTDEGGTPVWETELVLEDIVWDRTDGQLLDLDGYDPDDGDLWAGANRIKSATVANWSSVTDGYFTSPLKINVTYKPDDRGYMVDEKVDNTVYYTCTLTVLDANGSYVRESSGLDIRSEGAGQFEVEERTIEEMYVCDAFGLMTEQWYKEMSGGNISYQLASAGKVTYDSDGYPDQYIMMNSYDGAPMTYSSKIEYSDNYFSGIESVSVDNAGAPVEYYNLRGMRVAEGNLVPGVYVRRQGTTVTKVYVK